MIHTPVKLLLLTTYYSTGLYFIYQRQGCAITILCGLISILSQSLSLYTYTSFVTMSDLKYIMDTTDDEDRGNDKYSRRPGASDLARSSNPSSTTKQSDDNPPASSNPDTSVSQPRRRGLLSRSTRSATTLSPTTTTAGTDKASPSRPSLTERKSVDSTESMDPASYGSYHQSSSSTMPASGRSSVSSRPMPSAPGERDIPVKLTPITGRVSRAKKGVPVHTCDICKPPKVSCLQLLLVRRLTNHAQTFTRAEHLRYELWKEQAFASSPH